jgi:glutathione S-transferase|nr:glutathione S-transferase [uncultured Albidiferax sp.]
MPITLYRHAVSGHSHRVELMLSLLGLPCEQVDIDLLTGAHKTPAFLALNAFGQVPVLQDGDVTLADSNAILVYLASRYGPPGAWLPTEPVAAAQVQRWLSVAAGPLAFGPAVARVIQLFARPTDPMESIQRSTQLFGVVEAHLQQSDYLVGHTPTIADIAHYSYTAHAPEGNVSLEPYPQIRAWLARIEALPGFVPMVRSRIGLLA